MSGRTQFWIGSVMMALAIGLLVGGVIFPKAAYSQEGEGRTGRYALVTGIPGNTQKSQTLYLVDDLNEILYIFEYSSRAKELAVREVSDLRRYATKLLEARSKKERTKDRKR